MMKYYPSLTGLRALAAYMVFVHHHNFLSGIPQFSVLSGMIDEFYIGVSIFFVLSGFLIATRYASKAEMSPNFWRTYLTNRIARIYPMYFILTTVTFLVVVLTASGSFTLSENVIVYIFNITFLRGFFDSFKYSLITQGWTLTVEECFYVLAPIIFLFFRNLRQALFLVAAMLLGGLLLTMLFGPLGIYGLFANAPFTLYHTIFGRLFEFLAGVYLGYQCMNATVATKKSWKFTLSGICGILAIVYGLSEVQTYFNVQQAIFHPVGILINNFVLPIAVVSLIYGLISESNWFSRLLSSRPFDVLGKSSYVFYLIHMGVIYDAVVFFVPGDKYFIPFLVLNVLSIVMYYRMEAPLNTWIKDLAKRKSTLIAVPAGSPVKS
jgi:peptidoglycan/LPS O-acetylase OafA/YrhL